jgi:diacylglycerol O-acyltransferase / wax synthase
MATFDTLSAMDAQFLYWDSDRTPMNMGNLCIFEGGPLTDERGAFRLDDVRRAIESRLHLVPRYRRKVLEVPGGFAHPVLVDDPDFDIARHVRLVALPRPGTDEQLKELYSQLHEGMLDHGRPLWEITFIEGLEGGRVGMVQKIHHAPFDGTSTVDVMELLFDATPDHHPVDPPPWRPEPVPDPLSLMGAKWGEQVSNFWKRALSQPTAPSSQPDPLGEMAEAFQSLGAIGQPPKTSLNGPIGPRRRFDWVQTSLTEAKQIRTLAAGCTVNDAMIAAIGGGLRELLVSRGEAVDDLVLRIMVPVSLRSGPGMGDGAGNMVSGFVAPLPVCEADPVERLRRIHRSTRELKEGKQAQSIHLMTQSAEYAPASLMAAGARTAMEQSAFINLTVTNVPGPRRELFLLGARMLELHPMVLIGNQITVNVAVESYVDNLSIGLAADADANPDLDVLRDGIRRGLDELLERARAA